MESVHETRCLMSDVVGEVLGLFYSSCWRALHSEASTPVNERFSRRGFVRLASARSALGGVDAVE